MGVRFDVYPGSGRAKCQICRKIIEEGKMQVNGRSYQTAGSAHLDCILKLADRWKK